MYNVFENDGESEWQIVAQEYNISEEKQSFPILKVGDEIKYFSETLIFIPVHAQS